MTEMTSGERGVAEEFASALDGVSTSFEAAVEATGGVFSDRYVIAGSLVLLRFASERLREVLGPAFAHLAAPTDDGAAQPALTVHLWDSASTGAPPPPRPAPPGPHAPRSVFYVDRDPLRAVYRPEPASLSLFDSRVAWHWVDDASDIRYSDRASPLRHILYWWLPTQGYHQVHGGAVGFQDGGVLLVGKSGSGKSTSVLSSLGSTLQFAADDYVAVSGGDAPHIASLYNTGKLEPDHARGLFRHLVPLLSNTDRLEDEKAIIYAHEHFAQQMTSGFPLRAVLVPMVRATQRESRIVDITRTAAFAALAPSTVLQIHPVGQNAFTEMSQLIQRVPCHGIELGSDLTSIPRAIADFLGHRS
jgi:hypothetical protein